jgi:hypothetical protein
MHFQSKQRTAGPQPHVHPLFTHRQWTGDGNRVVETSSNIPYAGILWAYLGDDDRVICNLPTAVRHNCQLHCDNNNMGGPTLATLLPHGGRSCHQYYQR